MKSFGAYKVFQILLILIILEGVFTIFFYFQIPSEMKNTFWGGYSLQRLVLGALLLSILTIFILLFLASFTYSEPLRRIGEKITDTLAVYSYRTALLLPIAIILVLDLCSILFYLFPALLQLTPFVVLNRSLVERAGLMQVWILLISIKFLIFYFVFDDKRKSRQENPDVFFKLAILAWTVTGTILLLTLLWGLYTQSDLFQIFSGPAGKLIITSIWFSCWWMIYRKNTERATRYIIYFNSASIWLITFLISIQLAQWMHSLETPSNNYWNILAEAFLQGRLFLIDPPTTFDMTLYNGHWYVPSPPLPAFVLMPFIALWGVASVNTTVVSLALSSTIAVVMFLILEELSKLQWIKLSFSGRIWLVALLSFGTVQLWLSILSKMWWFSQICTELFIALAFLFALRKYSPWLTGFSLAAAIMARPNVAVIWPALLAISIQLQLNSAEKFSWKRLFAWAVSSALPVIFSVGFLLYYNFLRFGNFFDFGYVTINGSGWLVQRAKDYGIFNTIFIEFNIPNMFLALPYLQAQCEYYFPRGTGMSIFATTPAFLYLFRKFRISWWIIGCWASVLISVVLLAMYHNNGAIQYGYRYIVDFAVPIIMIISYNAGEKVSLPLKALIILSMLINYYGIISWFYGPC